MQQIIINSLTDVDLPTLTAQFAEFAEQKLQLLFEGIEEIELSLAVCIVRAARAHHITLVVGNKPAFVVTGSSAGTVIGYEPGPRAGLMIEQSEDGPAFMATAPEISSLLRDTIPELVDELSPGFDPESECDDDLADEVAELRVRADPLHPALALLLAGFIREMNPDSLLYKKLGSKGGWIQLWEPIV